MILEISIPLETVTEITDNGPKEVERKVFPGYVLVKMVMNDETWHVVRNIRGVTGFLGEGNKPIPLSEDDVAALGVEKREVVVGYQVGDSVKITDGALESFLGTVEEMDLERGKVRVVVSMFGRETPVELELDQVEPAAVPGKNKPCAALRPGRRNNVGGTGTVRPPNGLTAQPNHIFQWRCSFVAQKVTGYVKLQIPAGKATPAPPVGPALGQHGVNIAAFTKEFNERTKNDVV